MKTGLSAIDKRITYCVELVQRFPDNFHYRVMLTSLQQERANYANRIGRKNESRRKPK